MRLRPSLLVLPVLAIALLATGCFESTTAGTVSTPFTVAVGTGQTVVNPRTSGTPATSSSTATSTGTGTSATATTGTSTGGGTTDFTAAAQDVRDDLRRLPHAQRRQARAGTVGPNLDQLKPDEATVAHQIANGGGPMPAGLLKGQQAKDVAAYVAAVAGK